jgi:hypothetical protein
VRALTIAGTEAPGDACLRLCEPETRRYTDDGRLASTTPGGARPVVDVLELTAEEADAVARDRGSATPMLVAGSFSALGGADTLGRFLVGGAVLDTNRFDGHRCPSEQTALGLWRVARVRGGPFWDGVADVVASWVEERITTAPTSGPVHSVWGQGETHVRFLADAALLLLAAGRSAAAQRAVALLERFAVPFGGGQWCVHDSLELERAHEHGWPELVVNTHAQVMAVLAAAGRPTAAAETALDAALALSPPKVAVTASAALAVADLLGAGGPDRLRAAAHAVDRRAQRWIARRQHRAPFVRLPGGYVARDASGRPAPGYYFGVNLLDLGVLVANGVVRGDGAVGSAFRSGTRWARRLGTFAALRRAGIPIASLEPIVWQQAGRARDAEAAAHRLRRAGCALPPGSPGCLDAPWTAFSAGTI